MQQNPKYFAERLNRCLDDLGLPNNTRERSVILSKMLDIPKQQVWGLLEGQIFPDENLIEKIAIELEVDRDWLIENNGCLNNLCFR